MIDRVEGGGGLGCLVDAERGARILSLHSGGAEGRQTEWLAPSTDRWPPPTDEQGRPVFVRPGMGGWDEAFPTVSASTLADGTSLADHGEAWSRSWLPGEPVAGDSRNTVTTSVQLTSMPVSVTRTIAATADGLRLSYRATTGSPEPLPFLWSAHPQFAAEPGTTLQLLASSTASSEVAPQPGGAPGLVEEYPNRGARHDFSVAGSDVLGRLRPESSLKVFVDPQLKVAVALLRKRDGSTLRLSWYSEARLYLGLFWDRAEFAGGHVIALEPSTGFGDSAGAAERSGRVATVSASRPLDWHLDVSVF
ncbi:hypothetical protein C5B96_15760 [Subtercola sp. Z020]|uniref:hypothetical protein n=1 Tax=Subtercola sp. Z020 TaxID=2080582 RepID=UPI000CE7C793|nr:hypothetical protein [Subtercola sp. Z020]PPF77329.1 hypothetical protein C5B96_15760 [Subtercola sp. Z020]